MNLLNSLISSGEWLVIYCKPILIPEISPARFDNKYKIVDESRLKKVYLAGPDNLMLLLHTVRAILRDATMSQTAGKIQIEVNKLINDLTLLADRFNKLDKHFDLARKDLDDIKISHRKIESRGQVITSIEIDEKKKLQ